MESGENHQYDPADYRVRLFLSVDLSGSTAYKNSSAGLDLHEGVPLWVSAFRNFYGKFPSLLEKLYQKQQIAARTQGRCPRLWKAIGDELVFCGRVRSRVEIAGCIDVFVAALHEYRKLLRGTGTSHEKLDLKGSAWLAAFPAPNLAVRLRLRTGDPEYLSMSEALESAADDEPFEHDFLGKAIDTGFRVAASAERSRFAISVQLARVLLSLKAGEASSHTVRVDEPSILKGVNDGAPYPTLYIDTMEGFQFERVRIQERDLFEGNAKDPAKIRSYLDDYCSAVGTEDIALPDRIDEEATGNVREVEPPRSYLKLRESLTNALAKERHRGAEEQDMGNDPENEPAASFPNTELKPANA